MTCAVDHHEHGVSEVEFAAGTRSGRYRAGCGHLVTPHALTAPPGPLCALCPSRLPHPTETRTRPAHRLAARRGGLSLFGRRCRAVRRTD